MRALIAMAAAIRIIAWNALDENEILTDDAEALVYIADTSARKKMQIALRLLMGERVNSEYTLSEL